MTRSGLRAVIEPVAFLTCDECGRWRVVIHKHRTRFCDARCRSRFNMRAFRARAKANSESASSGLSRIPPATQPGAAHAVPATHAALPLAVTQASPAH